MEIFIAESLALMAEGNATEWPKTLMDFLMELIVEHFVMMPVIVDTKFSGYHNLQFIWLSTTVFGSHWSEMKVDHDVKAWFDDTTNAIEGV